MSHTGIPNVARRPPASGELLRHRGQPVVLAVREAIFDRHVAPLHEAELFQPSPERGQSRRVPSRRQAAEIADHRHRRLLRGRREWPRGRRAAEERYELAPLHSITSSARASTADDLVKWQLGKFLAQNFSSKLHSGLKANDVLSRRPRGLEQFPSPKQLHARPFYPHQTIISQRRCRAS